MTDRDVALSSPLRVVAAAWIVFAAMLPAFAKDVNQWAQAAEMPGQAGVAAVAGALFGAASAIGVVQARESANNAVKGMYDWPLELCALGQTLTQAQQVAQSELPQPDSNPAGGEVQAQVPPTKVLIVGDSFIEAQIGAKLEVLLERDYGVTVSRYGLRSTGLARLDYFDWPAKIQALKSNFQPDLVIGNWGANDCQGLTSADGKVLATFGTPEWDSEYGIRVRAVVKEMAQGGSKVVLFGLPSMRNLSLNNRVKRLNGVTEEAVAEAGGTYISVWDLTCDKNGKYIPTVSVGGKDRLMRMADGVHFSGPGAQYVAEKLIDILKRDYGLRQLD